MTSVTLARDNPVAVDVRRLGVIVRLMRDPVSGHLWVERVDRVACGDPDVLRQMMRKRAPVPLNPKNARV